MSLQAWESLSAEDRGDLPRRRARIEPVHARAVERRSRSVRASRRRPHGNTIIDRLRSQAVRGRDGRNLRESAATIPRPRPIDRTNSQGGVNSAWQHSGRTRPRNGGASLAARGRAGIVGLVRAVPIRWRMLSIAALNSAVVVVLAAMIWNGAKVLSSAWDDVRQVRESDKILALLESETSRLQNLIHRYINQPSPELFAEILLLHERGARHADARAPRSTRCCRARSRSCARVTERFLNGFGEVRDVQTTISKTYEDEVLDPGQGDGRALFDHRGRDRPARRPDLAVARKIARGLHRDAGRRQRLLSVARDRMPPTKPAATPRRSSRPSRSCRSRRQRPAAHGAAATAARGPRRCARASRNCREQLATRTELLRNTIDANQAEPSARSTNCRSRCGSASRRRRQTFDHTLADISRKVLSIAVIFLGIILTVGVLIALQHPPAAAADHGGDARHHLGRLRPPGPGHERPRRDRRDGARGRGVPRERHRQAQDRGRVARFEGEGRGRAARTATPPSRT